MADIEKQKAFEFVNWLLLPHFPCAKTQCVSILALSVDCWLKNRGCSLNKVGRNLVNVLSLPTNADTSATQALSTHSPCGKAKRWSKPWWGWRREAVAPSRADRRRPPSRQGSQGGWHRQAPYKIDHPIRTNRTLINIINIQAVLPIISNPPLI